MTPKIMNPLLMFSKLLEIKNIKISNLWLNNCGKINALSRFSNPFLYVILAFQPFISRHLYALVISVYSQCPIIENNKTKCINLNKIKC